MEKIKNFLLTLWVMLRYPIYVIAIGIIAGLITNNGYVGFFTIGGIIVLLFLFNVGRQLWWWFTKTGDYKDENQKG